MVTARKGTVGLGIIGAGAVGQFAHLARYGAIEDCRIVALAELRPKLGEKVAEKYGVPKVYGDHYGLLDDPEVDAVVVVTRRAATGPIVLDALNAGKHVLSEKPMAHTVDQAKRLVQAARRSGQCYAIGFMKRHDPGLRQAKQVFDRLSAAGSYGPVVGVRGYCLGGDSGRPQDGFIMTDEERPEGFELWPLAPDWVPRDMVGRYAQFLNVYSHILNILRYLFDAVPRVTAADLRDEGRIVVKIDFGGFEADLELAERELETWHEGIDIEFEKGRLRISFPAPLNQGAVAYFTAEGPAGAEPPAAEPIPPVWAFQRQAEAFVADILAGRKPLANGADAVHDLELAEDIWRMHLERHP